MNPQLFLVAIGVLTSCLNLLLALFLVLARGPNWKANRFFAGFLILSAVDMIGWAGDLLPPSFQPLLILRRSLAFMQMPWFFAYFLALLRPDRSSLIHRRVGWVLVAVSGASLAPEALAMLDIGLPIVSPGGDGSPPLRLNIATIVNSSATSVIGPICCLCTSNLDRIYLPSSGEVTYVRRIARGISRRAVGLPTRDYGLPYGSTCAS
jgi:hypothetical protein